MLEPKQRKKRARKQKKKKNSKAIKFLYLCSIECPVCDQNLRGTIAQIITPGVDDHSLVSESITGEK
jgi:hypothetical protein